MNYQASYGYLPPPRKRRGIKRLVFGILGIIANAIGLFVMPLVAGFIALMIAGVGSMELTPLDPDQARFEGSAMKAYSIAVPQEDLETVTCEIDGENISVEPGDPEVASGQVDGVDYYDVHEITVNSNQEVTVDCEGASAVALWEMGVGGTLISLGLGIVLPLALGFVALALTIWGIIALVRSS